MTNLMRFEVHPTVTVSSTMFEGVPRIVDFACSTVMTEGRRTIGYLHPEEHREYYGRLLIKRANKHLARRHQSRPYVEYACTRARHELGALPTTHRKSDAFPAAVLLFVCHTNIPHVVNFCYEERHAGRPNDYYFHKNT